MLNDDFIKFLEKKSCQKEIFGRGGKLQHFSVKKILGLPNN